MNATTSGPSRLPPALWVVGGLLVLAALALPWYVYSADGTPASVTGVGLFPYLPELGVLAAGGLALVLLGVALGRPRVWGTPLVQTSQAKLAVLVVALGTFVIPIEAAFRFASTSRTVGGTTFLFSVGPGWALALVGATLGLLGALGLLLRPSSLVAAKSAEGSSTPG